MVDHAHNLTIENRGEVTRLICSQCRLPFLEIINGEICLESKHRSAKHKNILTAEDVSLIAFVMWRQTHPPKQYW